ncbi:MAG: DUF262 domain-containing protein [Deltaproteobacteria bacterium]|nr:DUF262 domain-containing protein [Deltaproteobacteria bacterium]
MKRIKADEKGIADLLQNQHFSIDDYQREYKWTTKQVEELINDLANSFLEQWRDDHQREAVAEYGGYFLGSVVLSQKEGRSLIVDGQQRITTLTLLLMYLHRRAAKRNDVRQLEVLIFSWSGGKKAFNLDVSERTPQWKRSSTVRCQTRQGSPSRFETLSADSLTSRSCSPRLSPTRHCPGSWTGC